MSSHNARMTGKSMWKPFLLLPTIDENPSLHRVAQESVDVGHKRMHGDTDILTFEESQRTKKGKKKLTEVEEENQGNKVSGIADKEKGITSDGVTLSGVEASNVGEYIDISSDSER
ncbi:hypothetical protein RYX36_033946 [Vicia faba]